MINLGFWVDDDCNEFEYALLKSRMRIEDNDKVIIRIYTTLKCNANCAYCFENKTRENISITDTDMLVSFVKEKCAGYKTLVIEWFGGEPLLNQEAIDIISDELIRFCNENNIEYYSKMITNGYLLSNALSKYHFLRWNLKSVQITLDGSKNRYESIKRYGDDNSFDVVINNIADAINYGLHVIIRINYHYNSTRDTISLIEYLKERFANSTNLSVYAKHIFLTSAMDSQVAELADITVFETLYNNGFVKDILASIPDRKYKCIAYLTNTYLIYPDGRVGKCSQAMSEGDFIGDISHIDFMKMGKWCNNQISDKCKNCKLFPLCNSGCRYEELHNRKNCMIDETVFLHKLNMYLNQYH
jgi:uncharacterized protein